MLLERSRFSMILRLYAAAGALMAMGGFGYFLLRKLNIQIDREDEFALTLAFMGLIVAVFSNFSLSLIKEKSAYAKAVSNKDRLSLKLLESWNQFEKSGMRSIGEEGDGRPIPLRSMIRKLISLGAITPRHSSGLDEALKVRNRIAHGLSEDISASDLTDAIDEINDAIDYIDSKGQNQSG